MAYFMKPKASRGYLVTATRTASENMCTTGEAKKPDHALVYHIDHGNEIMKIAYPCLLIERNTTEGRLMVCSPLALTINNRQGMG